MSTRFNRFFVAGALLAVWALSSGCETLFAQTEFWAFLALITLVVLGIPLLMLIFGKSKKPRRAISYGSARLGTPEEAAKDGHLEGEGGLALGLVKSPEKRPKDQERLFRVHGQHVLTVAPTGAGKGIGCVIPNLLRYPGSAVVLDLKGEAFAVCARRRREMGQQVDLVDPFGITGASSSAVNWIDWIDLSDPDAVSEAASLADTLVVRSREGENYWDDAAANLLQGLILHVASLPADERHPAFIREMLTRPWDRLKAELELIGEDETTAWGIPARAANQFLAKADRERSGVLSVAQQHTVFLDDPRIVEAVRRSELDFRKLKTEPRTVFIAIPPDKLSAYNRFARAVLSLAIKGTVKVPGKPKFPVLYLLDELAQLGHFKPVEDGISILRGYGGLFWLLVQDLSQLKGTYPRWETFVANSVLQSFGTQDQMTAEIVSKMTGQTTIAVASTSKGHSTGRGLMGNLSDGVSVQETGRPVLMPDEVRRLDNRLTLVLQQGEFAHELWRLDYRIDREFEGQYDTNPMHQDLT